MSHQTGMKASDDLKKFLSTVKEGNTRALKVSIENEELVVADHKDVSGTWEEDFDSCILSMVVEKQPCYIFYRLDTTNNQGYEWLYISFSPDDAPTRQKMVYAGTRASLKLEFGGGHIAEDIFGTLISDVTYDGYLKHKGTKAAEAPLTMAEVELKEVKQQHLDASTNSKASTLPGVTFPMSEDAINELIRIAKKEIAYVQLSIDIGAEMINLGKSLDTLEVEALPTHVPTEQPRYHFYLFKHTHEGDYLESIVFVYSMPGYSCSVKERMLYSSCKATLLSGCEDVLKMEVSKKLEITEGSELTADFLQDELHPQKNVHRQKFSKPKPPGGRGAKRIIKPKQTEQNED